MSRRAYLTTAPDSEPCYLCELLAAQGADGPFVQTVDRQTGRPLVYFVFPSTLRCVRHYCRRTPPPDAR